ncbi:hypothetical protein SVIOM342S_01395 [Streptomyces violaceorubidus]
MRVRSRRAPVRVAAVSVSRSQNSSSAPGWRSATASSSSRRLRAASSRKASGTGFSSAESAPSAHTRARMRGRSTTPVKPLSVPMGRCTTRGTGCSRSRMEATAVSRSAPARSISVDERDPGHAVPVGLPPHGLALRLHPRDRVEHRDRAVQHPQGTFDLVGEVDVPRGVDEVDPVPCPGAADGRGEDGDAAIAFLRVEVGDGGAVVDLAPLVGGSGGVEDPLGDGGLAGVDVGEDAQVADGGERLGAGVGVGAHGR